MYQYLSAGKVLHNMTMIDLNDLAWLVEQNLKDVNRRIETLDKRAAHSQRVADVAAMAAADMAARERDKAKMEQADVASTPVTGVGGGGGVSGGDAMTKQQWYMDMMNGNNGNGADETMPFGDLGHSNVFWQNNYFP